MKRTRIILLAMIFFISGLSFGQKPCSHEEYLQEVYDQNEGYQELLHQKQLEISSYIEEHGASLFGGGGVDLLNQDHFTIPVVFHIIHSAGEGVGTGGNLSYAQILDQMANLNVEFDNLEIGFQGPIDFCLAQDPWIGDPDLVNWTDNTEPGVMRYVGDDLTLNPSANATGFQNLMSLTHPSFEHFPFANYLNVWIVNDIFTSNGDEVLGVAPVYIPGGLDGIIIDHDVVGDAANGFNVNAQFNEGDMLVHLIGHYLGLFHLNHMVVLSPCQGTSINDCDIEGDYVCDTPPCQHNSGHLCISGPQTQPLDGNYIPSMNDGGPLGSNSCHELGVNYPAFGTNPFLVMAPWVNTGNPALIALFQNDAFDLVESHMTFANDVCRQFFTTEQMNRMVANILLNRPYLSSAQNLIDVGVLGSECLGGPIDVAEINFDGAPVVCSNSDFIFNIPIDPNINYVSADWFVDGVLQTTDTQFTFNQGIAGNYTVSIQISNNDGTIYNEAVTIEVIDCENVCNLLCNGSFEVNSGNLYPGLGLGTAGTAFTACESSEPDIPCWQNSFFPIVIEEFHWANALAFHNYSFCDNSYDGQYILDNDRALVLNNNPEQNEITGVSQQTVELFGGEEYVLEFIYGYRNDEQANFQVLLDDIDACSNITTLGNYQPTDNAIDFSFTADPNDLGNWRFFSQNFVVPEGQSINCLRLSSHEGNENFQSFLFDDISITHVDQTPFSVIPEIDKTVVCQNQPFELNFDVVLDYVGVNSDVIVLELHFPDGVISSDGTGDFDINGLCTINTSTLDENGLTLTANLITDGTENLTDEYVVVVDINAASMVGCLNQVAVTRVHFNDFSADVNLSVDPLICDTDPMVNLNLIEDEPYEINCHFIQIPNEFEYSWLDELGNELSTDPNFQPIDLGNYQLNITDQSGCLYSENFEIIDGSPELVVNSDAQISDCPGNCNGQLEISITTEATVNSISWEGPDGFEAPEPIDNIQLLDELCPGVYYYDIEYGNGCLESGHVVIGGPTLDSDNIFEDGLTITAANYSDFIFDGEIVYFGQDLIFTDLSTLTLTYNDVEFIFGDGVSMIIDESATVVLNNCNLSSCSDNWDGVQVIADSQTLTEPGNFRMTEGRIRWAQNGIYSSDLNYPDTEEDEFLADELAEGGTIFCEDVLFENNLTSVFIEKSYSSTPSFIDCDFVVDDDLYEHFAEGSFEHLVRYHKITGYGFQSNGSIGDQLSEFENNMQNVGSWAERGMGIYSHDANFQVIGCKLSGFEFAIRSSIVLGFYNYSLYNNNNLYQNLKGIVVENMCFQEINENNIILNESTGVLALDESGDPEGIFINGGGYFEVMENVITGDKLDDGRYTIGIRFRDILTDSDMSYKNDLNDLNIGVMANGHNTTEDNNGGLEFICNSFDDCEYDIHISDFPGFDPSDVTIDQVQRYEEYDEFEELEEYSASNLLTLNPPYTESHLKYGSSWEVEYYFDPEIYAEEDLKFSFNIEKIELPESYHCQSLIRTILDDDLIVNWQILDKWENDAINAGTEFHSVKFLYHSLLDDGNTDALENEVTMSWSDDTWEMRQRLLDISPFVTRDVLFGVADRTDVFPHPIALEIFIANPDVLKDNAFIDYLSTKADPMPEYMIGILLASRDQETLRTELEEQIGSYADIYSDAIAHLIKANKLLGQTGSMELMENSDFILMEYGLLEYEILHQDLVQANNRKLDLEEFIGRNAYFADDFQEFNNWLDLVSEIVLQSKNWNQLNSSEISELLSLTDEFHTVAGKKAMAVLNYYYDGDFFIPPSINNDYSPRNYELEIKDTQTQELVTVYPNPGVEFVNIQFAIPNEIFKSFELRIFNNLGQLMDIVEVNQSSEMFTFDVSDWKTGIYFIEFEVPYYGLQSEKFEVLR